MPSRDQSCSLIAGPASSARYLLFVVRCFQGQMLGWTARYSLDVWLLESLVVLRERGSTGWKRRSQASSSSWERTRKSLVVLELVVLALSSPWPP